MGTHTSGKEKGYFNKDDCTCNECKIECKIECNTHHIHQYLNAVQHWYPINDITNQNVSQKKKYHETDILPVVVPTITSICLSKKRSSEQILIEIR
jgi:hypothetical protein